MQTFRNLKLFWKMMMLAALIPLTVAVTAGIAFNGTNKLKYEYDNLYGFMLIPIANLGEANVARETVEDELHQLIQADLSPDKRAELAEAVRNQDAKMTAIIARYEAEWLTTLSPEFSATLAALGQQSLQADEAEALAQFQSAYEAFAPKRDALLAGEAVNSEALETDLEQMEAAFASLMEVNLRFADLSNREAQAVIVNTRRTLLIVSGLISLVALAAAWQLARLVVGPVALLTRATRQLAEGNLDVQVAVRSNDEVGQMASAFTRMIVYLQNMAGVAEKMADGDLTEDVTPQSEKDVLGSAFARMIVNLRNLVSQVEENANSLSAASGQLAASAGQAGQATSQIATTIQQVAKGTAQQTEGVTRTAASVEQMKRAIDGVAKGAQEQAAAVGRASAITAQITSAIQQAAGNVQAVTKDSALAAEAARAGSKAVQETIAGMTNIIAKVGVSSDKVAEMGHRSDQIGAIVETIDDIASQTNLLALNAAIEAARAGEHGKGFAVVADEVRKLAERASAATKEIGGLIRGIQQTVNEAVAAMDEGSKEVESGAVRVSESGQALSSILKAVEAVNQQAEAALTAARQISAASNELVGAMDEASAVVEQNTAATEEMASGSAGVTQAIENIASVSEENNASVEEVSASAEEMSAQVEEVTASAQSLSEMAETLRQLVSQFTLKNGEGRAVDSGLAATAGQPGAAQKTVGLAIPNRVGNGNGRHYEDLPLGR